MAWLKKKDTKVKKIDSDAYNEESEDLDNDYDSDDEDTAEQVSKNPLIRKEAPEQNEKVIPFSRPAMEGLAVGNTVIADNLWAALAEIMNRQARLEKRVNRLYESLSSN